MHTKMQTSVKLAMVSFEGNNLFSCKCDPWYSRNMPNSMSYQVFRRQVALDLCCSIQQEGFDCEVFYRPLYRCDTAKAWLNKQPHFRGWIVRQAEFQSQLSRNAYLDAHVCQACDGSVWRLLSGRCDPYCSKLKPMCQSQCYTSHLKGPVALDYGTLFRRMDCIIKWFGNGNVYSGCVQIFKWTNIDKSKYLRCEGTGWSWVYTRE